MRINKDKFEEELNAAVKEVGMGRSFEEKICIWAGPDVQVHLVVTRDESEFLDGEFPGLIL